MYDKRESIITIKQNISAEKRGQTFELPNTYHEAAQLVLNKIFAFGTAP